MKELGLFGVTIAEEYGGLGLDLTTYALIQVELSRGWMSLSGILNTHFISAWMIKTLRNRGAARALPPAHGHRRAAGGIRDDRARGRLGRPGDPDAGRSRRRRLGHHGPEDVDDERPARRVVMLLAKTDPEAMPAHRGMTAFMLEKEPGVAEQPGLTIPPPLGSSDTRASSRPSSFRRFSRAGRCGAGR